MCTRRSTLTLLGHASAMAVAMVTLLAPRPALAQQGDRWEVTVAPLYLWATKIDGELTARGTTVPVFLSFADAADNLGASFSVHVEARKGRWGLFSDLNFVRLSSDAEFSRPGTSLPVIEGEFDFDNTIFEAGGSYRMNEASPLALIGGLRTYSISPKVEFTTPNLTIASIDVSRTSVNAFAGFTFRPQLSPKVTFLSRGDLGAGDGFTWSGMVGFEFRPKPWAGLVAGYKAFGIDVGSDDDEPVREYDVTHYGPIVGLNLHFGGK